MKKILLFMLVLLLINTSWAQEAPPEMFKFQAYIYKPNGNPVADKTVGVEISIYQTVLNGILVYTEEFTTTTNKNGIINLEIGNGVPTFGTFSLIPWEAGEFFLELSADIDGGTNYTIMGASQLLSVPYALLAKNALSALDDLDTDPTNEIELPVTANENDILTFVDDTWVAFPNEDGDSTNEIQDLQLVGNILTITLNGTPTEIDLTTYLDDTNTQLTETEVVAMVENNGFQQIADDGDIDATNEFQTISINDHDLTIRDGNTITLPDNVDDADFDPTNELQSLNLSGTSLSITGSNSVNFSGVFDSRYVNTSGDTMSGNLSLTGDLSVTGQILSFVNGQWVPKPDNVDDADSDPNNEIQDISINGHDLSITGGSTIPLPAADGSETKVTGGTNVTVTGSGTTANPYVINETGAATHTIGESFGGGIIFYLDASGQHGLIAAATDQSTGIEWTYGVNTNTTAYASSVGGGDGNTSMIVHTQGLGSYAARLCFDLYTAGYGDWYLPSKYELDLMRENIGPGNVLGLGNVGGFASGDYWSSTEYDPSTAWYGRFSGYGGWGYGPKNTTLNVRAVRAF